MTKKKFILDYSVIMNAIKLKNSVGEIDTSAINVLVTIIHECHNLVLTPNMEKNYFDKISFLKRKKELKIDITRLLTIAMSTGGKIDWKSNNLEPVADEHLVPKNDIKLIRLARISHGIIVTSDERLISSLEKHCFGKKYGISFIRTKDFLNRQI